MDVTLITGASSGLGEGFARALAARKHNLLLVARRQERLAELAVELERGNDVSVKTIALDLAAPDAGARLMTEVAERGLRVETLINNAGFGARGAFADIGLAEQQRMIALNCAALVDLCHRVLPDMIARKSGGILNVASTAAFQPGPWMAVYYATKAFVLSFSEALHEEVRGHGIRVAALCPGPTRTEFADVAGMADSELFKRFASPSSAVVRDGLAALEHNQAVKISGALNAIMAESIRFTPRALARRIAGGMQKARSA
ncbi:SDR family NAD(P)-dependent oxidoreductase [Sphingomonas sp. MAH-20]|uniref:SDR family NAD(P)-dependent oxidoreductase n=1 Tax=Sphingomonas horti TaxID=2682842 RepID=A0A6I4IY50_9SPHN|nr:MULTISPECIES: SDR family oxidoreductase [Sphingomonas]MBA2918171.1 SDR family oxidoreductase [Sphingomonas sp. CGMCC 1.13658]MVO77140.1 SDR family NAD(P)-dependent oxidoreductase [Sphingomonas horti]